MMARGPLRKKRVAADVTLAGRGMRLWLAPAESVLCVHGDPVALAWRAGRVGLMADVINEDSLPAWSGAGQLIRLHGAPGARYTYLSPIAPLLKSYGITKFARLAWDPARLWLGPLAPPTAVLGEESQYEVRHVRSDGRLEIGVLRGQGALPTPLRLIIQRNPPRVELRVGIRLDPGDPAVIPVRGTTAAPYVYLTGPVGRNAREVLGVVGSRGSRVWVRAEVGTLVVLPAIERRRARPRGDNAR